MVWSTSTKGTAAKTAASDLARDSTPATSFPRRCLPKQSVRAPPDHPRAGPEIAASTGEGCRLPPPWPPIPAPSARRRPARQHAGPPRSEQDARRGEARHLPSRGLHNREGHRPRGAPTPRRYRAGGPSCWWPRAAAQSPLRIGTTRVKQVDARGRLKSYTAGGSTCCWKRPAGWSPKTRRWSRSPLGPGPRKGHGLPSFG